jgi:thiol-disulfide isomerase/thioredoxin
MRIRFLITLLFAFHLFTGCKEIKQEELFPEITVEIAGETELTKLISERNGKFLFLNIWATWCVPCVEEFPALVKLVEKYKNRKIEFIGLSIDYVEDKEQKVVPFLKKQNANFTNFINGFKKDEQLINFISEDWNGAVPLTVIYNNEGKQLLRLEGAHSFEDFSQKIESLLNE